MQDAILRKKRIIPIKYRHYEKTTCKKFACGFEKIILLLLLLQHQMISAMIQAHITMLQNQVELQRT